MSDEYHHNNDFQREHHQHHEQHDQQQHQHHEQHQDAPNVVPSAPSADENGFYVVQQEQVQQVVDGVSEAAKEVNDEVNALIANLSAKANEEMGKLTDKPIIDLISSSGNEAEVPKSQPAKPAESEHSSCKKGNSSCSVCPYYFLGMKYLGERFEQVPPKVKDLLLWKCPKKTGAVFGTSLALLISLASFSFLTVISTLMLLAIAAVGSYRFYLAVIFRIKGTSDDTLEKLLSCNVSLPKDKFQELSRLLETDINRFLNKIKSIVLWENVTNSSLAFIGSYIIYCIGCVFNTLTLVILALVSAFTLPKIYDVYKVPIDQFLEKVTSACHHGVKQVMVKLPFLNKKKTQ